MPKVKTPIPKVTISSMEVDELLAVLWQAIDVCGQHGGDPDLVKRFKRCIDGLRAKSLQGGHHPGNALNDEGTN
jgi:hypothetical protein